MDYWSSWAPATMATTIITDKKAYHLSSTSYFHNAKEC
ncbi:hypothetical protein ID866_11178 [Astraeus odoratus]|nr:hypothetical protein ID866_11178 [Astraeus odoratus]